MANALLRPSNPRPGGVRPTAARRPIDGFSEPLPQPDVPLTPRDYGCLAVAAVLLVAGTFATGFLPPTLLSQWIAGGLVVAAFAVVFVCLRD